MNVHLYVRAGSDVALDSNGYVLADYVSNTAGGNQRILITPSAGSGPSTYYIAFGVFTTGVDVPGSITANVSGATCAGMTLLSGSFTLPAVDVSTLFYGDYGVRVNVPRGVSKFKITANIATPNVALFLYSRLGQDVALDPNGYVIADSASDGDGRSQSIVITTPPAFQGGTYYVGFGLFTTGTDVSGSIQAVAIE